MAWPWSEGRRRCRDTAISRLAAGVMWKYTHKGPDEALTLIALIEPRRHTHARTHAQTQTHLGQSVDALKSCLASASAAVAPVDGMIEGGSGLRLVNHCSCVVCACFLIHRVVPIIHQLLASGACWLTADPNEQNGRRARLRPPQRAIPINPTHVGPVQEAQEQSDAPSSAPIKAEKEGCGALGALLGGDGRHQQPTTHLCV